MSKAEELNREMRAMEFFNGKTAEISKAYEEYKKAVQNYIVAYDNYMAVIQDDFVKQAYLNIKEHDGVIKNNG